MYLMPRSRVLALLFAATVISPGCTVPRTPRDSVDPSLFETAGDAEVALRLVLAEDTLGTAARKGEILYYYIVNGSSPRQLDLNPGNFRITVRTESGDVVKPSNVASPASGSWGQTTLMLPARAILGQALDLRCIRDGAGYSGDPLEKEDCLGGYRLHVPGVYEIILQYLLDDITSRELAEDAVVTDTSIAAAADMGLSGRWLADSVKVVVVDR